MDKLKRISVNRHHIAYNKAHKTDRLPLSLYESGQPVRHGDTIEIQGPSKVIYSPDKPMKCGATVWIETRSEVRIFVTPKDPTRAMKMLGAYEGSILARIVGNPKLAKAEGRALLDKLSPEGQDIAHCLMQDGVPVSLSAIGATYAITMWAARQHRRKKV